ncbi:MAG: LamG domain-containing protein, partial [Planctomycetota bacterium]
MWRRPIFTLSVVLALVWGGYARAELIAHYTFDDYTANDSAHYYPSSVDANGTLYGDAHVVDDVNRESPVLVLDGDDDYVRVLDGNVADINEESFTYAFWAGEDIEEIGLIGVTVQLDNSREVRYTLYNDRGCDCAGECKVRTEVPDTNIVGVGWVHIACVRDATVNKLRFYVNAELEPGNNPATDCVKSITNAGSLFIGANYRPHSGLPDPSGWFPGMIDDFRVYNHALTVEEIEELVVQTPDPNLASNPSPRNYLGNVCPDVELSWDAGANAADANGHDVYFGTDFSDVNDANIGEPRGVYVDRQSDVNYNPPGLLEYGTTYYWRIDEVNGLDIWKGQVWRFTVEEGKAREPNPADGSGSVPASKVLSWTPGCLATSHDVYFGSDFNDVNDATDANVGPGRGRQEAHETTYDPPEELIGAITYYWRIDENGGPAGSIKGDVWSFTVAGGIVAYYKFDEREGDVAYDSSGLEREAGIAGDNEDKWNPDGRYDYCLEFDGDTHVSVPTAVLKDINEGITFAVWLNNDSGRYSGDAIFETGVDDFFLRAEAPDSSGDVYWRGGYDDANDIIEWTGGNPDSWVGVWNHFTFIKDANKGEMYVYFNGEEADSLSGASDTLAGVRNTTFRIGSGTDGEDDYEGKMDDVRIYDYALSATEVAELYRGGELGIAWGPSPYHGQRDALRDANLAWKPGDYAADHNVFFGTSWEDVNAMTDPCATKSLGNESYDLPILDLDTTYYWRIDEHNDPCTWPGPIWRFKVADYLVVDDMESYDTSGELQDTWVDWRHQGELRTGANLYLGERPLYPVHGGTKTMRYGYTTGISGFELTYAEAWLPIPAEEKDWTREGVKILTLYFYGKSTNDACDTEQMYIGLEDTDGNYAEIRYGDYREGENMGELTMEEWHEWFILLEDFNDATYAEVPNDVNLEDVNRLYIGFGNRRTFVSEGGTGEVRFDDIWLQLPVCIPEYGPAADFSSDCIVNAGDVGAIADNWLIADVNLVGQVQKPDDANLLGWWKLDGDANDSSGNGHDGSVEHFRYYWVIGYDDVNLALYITGEPARILVPDSAELRPKQQLSVCAWVHYSEEQPESSRIVVKGADNREAYAIEVGDEDRFSFYVRDANKLDKDDYWKRDVNTSVWRH